MHMHALGCDKRAHRRMSPPHLQALPHCLPHARTHRQTDTHSSSSLQFTSLQDMTQNDFNVTVLQPWPHCIIPPYEELYIAAWGSSGKQLQVMNTAHAHTQTTTIITEGSLVSPLLHALILNVFTLSHSFSTWLD